MGIDSLDALSRPVTLRGQVESFLREAITTGRLLPGERLVERELCEKLKVSRPSLREALRVLEAERLVHNVPHRGPVVASMTEAEVRDIYGLRALLEGFAAQEFARLAGDASVAVLGRAVARLRSAAVEGGQQQVVAAKAVFYEVLLAQCGNPLVAEILRAMLLRVSLLRATSLAQPSRLEKSLDEIDLIYGAIVRREPELARERMEEHVRHAQEAALAVLAAQAQALQGGDRETTATGDKA